MHTGQHLDLETFATRLTPPPKHNEVLVVITSASGEYMGSFNWRIDDMAPVVLLGQESVYQEVHIGGVKTKNYRPTPNGGVRRITPEPTVNVPRRIPQDASPAKVHN